MNRKINFSFWALFPAGIFLLNIAAADTLDAASVRRFQSQTTAATQGKADDQFRLGEMYEQGQGTRTDLAMAYLWYNKAASQGHAAAKEKIAIMDQNKAGGSDEQARVDAAMRALQQQSDRDKAKPSARGEKPVEAAKPQQKAAPVAKVPEPSQPPAPATPPAPAKATEGEFSTNPCKGPQAKFLSTCN